MDREHVNQAVQHFIEQPLVRLAVWLVSGLFGALITVSVALVAYYAGDMRDSIDELKMTVKEVIGRVEKLERSEEIRQAQWDAYREVYVKDVQRYGREHTADVSE
jgi:hypothetical protein